MSKRCGESTESSSARKKSRTASVSISMLLFDLDGTLLDPGLSIRSRNVATLKRLLAAGVQVGFSTGRSIGASRDALDTLGSRVSPLILYSGALVLGRDGDAKNGGATALNRPILFSKCMSTEDCVRSLRAAAGVKEATPFLFLADGSVCVEQRDSNVVEYEAMFHLQAKVAEGALLDLAAAGSPPFSSPGVLKICWMSGKPLNTLPVHEAAIDRVAAALRGLPADMHDMVKRSVKAGIDVAPPGINKAAPFAELSRNCGIESSQICAFGDAQNDMEVLKEAGLGVAMGNASSEVKSVSDIVIGTHDTDAISEFLDRCVLEQKPEGGARLQVELSSREPVAQGDDAPKE